MPNVIIVNTLGPQGQTGPQGIQGPSGSLSINSSGSFGITGSLFISGSAPLVVTGPTVLSGSLNATQGITGSLLGTATNALTASYTTNISGGSAGYVPLWKTDSTLGTSSIHQDDGNVGIGILLPEAKLHVKGPGSTDLYTSLLIQNSNGNPSFVVLGSGHVGIENLFPSYELDVTGTGRFTNGLLVTGSLRAPSITGSLEGTASSAVSSSYALTASYAANVPVTASYALSASVAVSSSYALSASYLIGQSPTSSYALTASYLNPLNQDVSLTGNLTINGTASISYLNVSYESASIIYSSGSNQLGDAVNDTQTLYGTVVIPTGSLTVTGSTSISGSIVVDLGAIGSGAIDGLLLQNTASATASTRQRSPSLHFRGASWNDTSGGRSQQADFNIQYVPNSPDGNGSGTLTFFGQASGSTNDSLLTLGTGIGGSAKTVTVTAPGGFIANGSFNTQLSYVIVSQNISQTSAAQTSYFLGKLGVGLSAPTAQFQVKGSGATSSTTALLVQNANASQSLKVADDGAVEMGNASYSFGNALLSLTTSAGSMNFRVGGANTLYVSAGLSATILASNDYVQCIRVLVGNGTARLTATTTDWLSITDSAQTANGSGNLSAKFGTFGTTYATINASAQVEITSTTKGFLLPRTNLTSNISTPAQGLQTYITSSTSEGLYYYNSGSYQGWTRVLNDSGSQAITGSLTVTGGITGSLFGTSSWSVNALTASYALNAGDSVWTGSAGNIYYSSGNVGIGTNSPTYPLSVQGMSYFNTNTSSTNSILRLTDASNGTAWVGFSSTTATGFFIGSNGGMTLGKVTADNSNPSTSHAQVIINQNGNANLQLTTNTANTGIVFSDGVNATIRMNFPSSGEAAITTISGHNLSIGVASSVGSLSATTMKFFQSTGNVSIGNTTDSARLFVKGSGATSSTTALLIQNSDNSYNFSIRDDGNLTASSNFISINGYDTTINGSNAVKVNGTAFNTGYIYRNTESGFLTLGNDGTVASGITLYGSTHSTLPNVIRVTQSGSIVMTIASGSVGIGTSGSSAKLAVYKSGSTVVDIQGSQGQLFSVIDTLSGSLMSVNDISGLPILEVFSDDRVVMGTYGNAGLIVTGSDVQISASLFGTRQTGSLAVGSTLLYTVNTGSYTAGFFDYFVNSGSNYRAGNIMAVFGAGTYKFTDLATPDIGSTTNLQFSMSMAGASAQLYASASSAGWTVKTTFRTI